MGKASRRKREWRGAPGDSLNLMVGGGLPAVNQGQAPEPYRSLCAAQARADALTFREDPNLQEFIRPYVPGEFWPHLPEDCHATRVRRIGPGARTRTPVFEHRNAFVALAPEFVEVLASNTEAAPEDDGQETSDS